MFNILKLMLILLDFGNIFSLYSADSWYFTYTKKKKKLKMEFGIKR